MSPFQAAVSDCMPAAGELPSIHTSLSECLESFARTGQIEPRECNVFGESLIYLFYGRPAYRSSRSSTAGATVALCPVCFVFKPYTVTANLHAAYPCDTGALVENRFSPEILQSDLQHLALEPRIESVRRAVTLFFETHSSYFAGRASSIRTFPEGTVMDRFQKLLTRRGNEDDRKSAIELIANRPLPLKDQLLFVVLPNEFLDDPMILNIILHEWNCDPIGYSTVQASSPADYYGVVRDLIIRRFSEAKRISL